MSDSSLAVVPDGTTALGGWAVTGAGSAHTALSDATNASYVEGSGAAGGILEVTVGAIALSTHDLVRYLQPTIRANSPGGNRTVAVRLHGPSATQRQPEQTIVLDGTIRDYSLQAFRAWPNGVAFTDEDLAGLSLEIREVDNPAGSLRVYEAGVTAVYNSAPSVVLDTLTTPVTDTALVVGSWAYTDPEGDLQERYQERVYGYDPSIGWPNSGGADNEVEWLEAAGAVPIRDVEVLSNATTTEPLVFPPTGNFRRYIRVSDRGSGGRFGSYASQEWDMLIDEAPTAPALTVTPEPLLARVALVVNPTLGSPVDYLEVQRSDDGGVTWVTVRDADPTYPYIPDNVNRINNGGFEGDTNGDGVANAWSIYQSPTEGVVTPSAAAGVQRVGWTTNTGLKGLTTRPHVNPDGSNIWPADSVWLLRLRFGSDVATPPTISFDAGGFTVVPVIEPAATVGLQDYLYRVTLGVTDVESDLHISSAGAANHHFDISEVQLEHAPGSAGGGGYGSSPYADIAYAGSPPADPTLATPSAFIPREEANATIYDRFAPREVTVLYRARVAAKEGSGGDWGAIVKASAWVTDAGTVLVNDENSWFTCPTDDTLDMAFLHAGTSFDGVAVEDLAVYWPEQRTTPVINGGTVHSEQFNGITLVFTSEAQAAAFRLLRATRQPVLFRTLYGEGPLEQHWVRIGEQVTDERVGGYHIMEKGQLHRVTFTAYEVTEPAVI